MGLNFTHEQVGPLTWREQEVPVTADLNDRGLPVGIQKIQIADMPPGMREAVWHWATEIRILKMGMPPSGCAYYLEDIEEFIAWELEQLAGADEA